MSETREFASHVVDLLEVFGPCEARRMFGGFGIFHRGLMFALIADGTLYLKADDRNRPLFESAGCERFSYVRQGRPYRLSYYTAPETFFDDTGACLEWARSAFDAALRKSADERKKIVTEWILLIALLALLVYGVIIYNRLVRDRQRTFAGWSDIEVQLKRRHELIPKLVEAVRRYAAYEQSTLDRVTALRNEARDIRDAAGQGQLESGISRGLLSIFALQEAYPELKADRSFLQLQNEISAVEADIQFARRYYNGAVRNLNTRIESFPDLLLARAFGYRQAGYFEFEETRR